ncbi:alpha/beta hydrolase family protein [Parabacteroides bouchesdurhonensis]|uniref:alpha/beta hydrolase family protein n=1 Tax=Parabacteroides bouchesdurhonensis TaxID=1936995 RepID=UPI000E4EB9C1|nr:prolyl oligopeptidase family serine peptidase [Parabacteroides bouchesdurhonensis]RHJ92924.1 S9 family peptidase [Bacteroides sp. AM07-16]
MNKLFAILMLLVVAMTTNAQQTSSDLVLKFQGRDVNIAPFFQDFPYSQFSLSDDGTKLFFFKTSNENKLQWLDIAKEQDLSKATDVVDLDFSKRNCWRPQYNDKDGCVYWIGDENNEEIINIYRSNLLSPNPEKLTNVPYIYAWDFNPQKDKIAYVARLAQNEKRLDELRILDLKTGKDELVRQDEPDFRYTWGDVSWQPDGKGLMILALKDADRQYANIVYIDTETKKTTVLTDASRKASYAGTSVMQEWISPDECFYFSDQDGYKNIYRFDRKSMKSTQVTHFTTDIEDARFVTIKNEKYLFVLQSNPIETSMMLMDIKTGKMLYKQTSDLSLSIGAVKGNEVSMLANSTSVVFQIVKAEVGKKSMKLNVTFDLPEALKAKLVHSDVERLSIPTFDIDPATGKERLLHAYLYKPKNPLPAGKEIIMIESFYGGDNRYNTEYQIYNAAGITVLSPSPRGSSGFGRDFAAMNDKDLGGNEIIDIIYCAKYISDKLNVPAERVGVFGMSHGGYATMRLVTFPGEVNGNKAHFKFGFGIETAGFCDIIYQHTHSNIPDWTYLEAGDPVADKAKLIDRSSLYHAEKLTGPLLLLHGNHDNRVDIEGSRLMDRKLIQLGLPHRYVEFEGLGHGIKGVDNNRKFYYECFRFLDEIENH